MNVGIRRPIAIAAALCLLVAALVSGAFAARAQQTASLVQVANNSTFGPILLSSQGMTLYTLSTEADGTIHCTGACLSAWPPLLLPAGSTTPTVGPRVTGTVGTSARPDGTAQVTHNGMPVYTFAGDSAAGQTNGPGVVAFGGTWFAVKVAAAPSTTATATTTATTTAPPPASGPQVLVANNPTLGNILVSPEGLTLYYNTAEHGTAIACTGGCLAHWLPILLPAGVTTPTAGSGIVGTLSSITRPDGGQQVTYNDEPLYTFAGDTKPGDINGEGIKAFGGVWHAARANPVALSAVEAVPLSVRVTTTGVTAWGKVTVSYTLAGSRMRQTCSSARCTLAVPAGVLLHLTESARSASTWRFKEWKISPRAAQASRATMSNRGALKLTARTHHCGLPAERLDLTQTNGVAGRQLSLATLLHSSLGTVGFRPAAALFSRSGRPCGMREQSEV